MSKPLALLNREDKGDVDPGSRGFFSQKVSARFRSYFDDFGAFARFLMLQMGAVLRKRRVRPKHEISPTAAFMAIV